MKRVAILQSNYIPWKGYFDLIAAVDEFIIYDNVQFTKNDWRNRNQIKTASGKSWLSIPVGSSISRQIRDVELPSDAWRIDHWNKLTQNYRKARFFSEIADWLKPFYLESAWTHLSVCNRAFIEKINEYLGIRTALKWSWEYDTAGNDPTDRLVNVCFQAGATEYVSGPAAKSYLATDAFTSRKIAVTWFNYDGYAEYEQLSKPFDHHVSILDMLFNCGKTAPRFMKFVNARDSER